MSLLISGSLWAVLFSLESDRASSESIEIQQVVGTRLPVGIPRSVVVLGKNLHKARGAFLNDTTPLRLEVFHPSVALVSVKVEEPGKHLLNLRGNDTSGTAPLSVVLPQDLRKRSCQDMLNVMKPLRLAMLRLAMEAGKETNEASGHLDILQSRFRGELDALVSAGHKALERISRELPGHTVCMGRCPEDRMYEYTANHLTVLSHLLTTFISRANPRGSLMGVPGLGSGVVTYPNTVMSQHFKTAGTLASIYTSISDSSELPISFQQGSLSYQFTPRKMGEGMDITVLSEKHFASGASVGRNFLENFIARDPKDLPKSAGELDLDTGAIQLRQRFGLTGAQLERAVGGVPHLDFEMTGIAIRVSDSEWGQPYVLFGEGRWPENMPFGLAGKPFLYVTGGHRNGKPLLPLEYVERFILNQ